MIYVLTRLHQMQIMLYVMARLHHIQIVLYNSDMGGRRNEQWTSQRHWQHWAYKTQDDEKQNTQKHHKKMSYPTNKRG